MKISAILFFIIVAIYVIIRDNIGFSQYEVAGGPFLGVGTFTAFQNCFHAMNAAIFSFSGTELVGITAGEAKNPRKSVPKAINGTFWRIAIFYLVSIFLIGILLPANLPQFQSKDDLVKSPFVIALKTAGISYVDHFMNFVCFIAVFSAANSTVYASTRSLMSLALENHAPRFLAKTSKNGVPYYALFVSLMVGCVCFLGSFIGEGKVFAWLINIVGLGVIIIWMMICLVHIRFRKAYLAQGYKLADLPFKAMFFPYGAYFSIFVTASILVFSPVLAAYEAHLKPNGNVLVDFMASFITVPFYLLLFVGWKFYKKTKFVPLKQVDVRTGNINLFPIRVDVNEKPNGWFEKFLGLIS